MAYGSCKKISGSGSQCDVLTRMINIATELLTIQMVVALNPLYKNSIGIVVSTYQSVTGTGVKAVTQLMNERKA